MSDHSVKLHPYEELCYEWHGTDGRLTLQTEWTKVIARLDATAERRMRLALEHWPTIDECSQDLFATFRDYPFFYYSPRKFCSTTEHRDATDEGVAWESASNFEGQWEIEPWLDRCRVEKNAFDPMSVLSILRRSHYREMVRSGATQRLHKTLGELAGRGDERFRRAMSLVIRQNHFVTEKAEPYLTPALDLYPPARACLLHFLASERGHSALLAESLDALGAGEKSPPVIGEFSDLMDNLALAARTSVTGLACIIDTFEAASQGADDPFARLLNSSEFRSAARGLTAHHEINRLAKHHQFAETLLAILPPIDLSSVRLAARLAERNSRLQIAGCDRLCELII